MLRHKPSSTPVGIVRNALREDETVVITDIENMTGQLIDMLTVVIVGNSATRHLGDFMVTPRGYRL
jgi:precorrin-3B methylase